MTRKYRYKIIDTAGTGVPLVGPEDDLYINRLTGGLDELGDEAWELCAALGTFLIFKREYWF